MIQDAWPERHGDQADLSAVQPRAEAKLFLPGYRPVCGSGAGSCQSLIERGEYEPVTLTEGGPRNGAFHTVQRITNALGVSMVEIARGAEK